MMIQKEMSFGMNWPAAAVGATRSTEIRTMSSEMRDELVSITSAESDYGVIINACSMTVDEKATSSLREEMRETHQFKTFVCLLGRQRHGEGSRSRRIEQAHKRT